MDCSAEANLVNALFVVDSKDLDKAAVLVRPDDFRNPNHRALYRAMLWCRDNGKPIDSVSVYEAFTEAGVDDGHLIIASAFDAWPMEGQVERYAKLVKEEARAANLEKTIKLANERLTDGENLTWVKNELVQDIEESDIEANTQEGCHVAEAADKALAGIYDRMLGDDSKRGLRTGILPLDELTTGINREELWVVGGMPGRGKTAFALQVALNIAADGKAVHYISLEMSRTALVTRLLKMRFGSAAIENLKTGFDQLVGYKCELETYPMYIDDPSSMDIDEVVARARARIARSHTDVVIVDYLQLIRSAGGDRRERVSEATDRLRRLAKDTGVPVLALSQLRRPQDIDDRPSMIDLKESGDIEAHAHVVLLLYMPTNAKGEDEIIIGKQREGPTGKIDVAFYGEKGRFYERAKQ